MPPWKRRRRFSYRKNKYMTCNKLHAKMKRSLHDMVCNGKTVNEVHAKYGIPKRTLRRYRLQKIFNRPGVFYIDPSNYHNKFAKTSPNIGNYTPRVKSVFQHDQPSLKIESGSTTLDESSLKGQMGIYDSIIDFGEDSDEDEFWNVRCEFLATELDNMLRIMKILNK